MTKRGKEKAGLIFVKEKRGCVPVSQFDQEQWERFPLGAEFDLSERTRRSLPLHRTYWKALSNIVAATEAWATHEELHDALKRDLGYVTVAQGLDGKFYVTTDSTAFDAMKQSEFKAYADKAFARLAEVTGMDPLAFLEEAKAA